MSRGRRAEHVRRLLSEVFVASPRPGGWIVQGLIACIPGLKACGDEPTARDGRPSTQAGTSPLPSGCGAIRRLAGRPLSALRSAGWQGNQATRNPRETFVCQCGGPSGLGCGIEPRDSGCAYRDGALASPVALGRAARVHTLRWFW